MRGTAPGPEPLDAALASPPPRGAHPAGPMGRRAGTARDRAAASGKAGPGRGPRAGVCPTPSARFRGDSPALVPDRV
jgi:hypothetical protein